MRSSEKNIHVKSSDLQIIPLLLLGFAPPYPYANEKFYTIRQNCGVTVCFVQSEPRIFFFKRRKLQELDFKRTHNKCLFQFLEFFALNNFQTRPGASEGDFPHKLAIGSSIKKGQKIGHMCLAVNSLL